MSIHALSRQEVLHEETMWKKLQNVNLLDVFHATTCGACLLFYCFTALPGGEDHEVAESPQHR